MLESDKKPLTLFYCYAYEDQQLYYELDRHLKGLIRNYDITVAEHRAGQDWKGDLDHYLDTANIFLLLISSDFISWDEYDDIMERVLKKHKEGNVHVACVLLRSTYFEDEPFSTLRFLNKKPVTHWDDRDAAYASIQKKLKIVCGELQTSRTFSEEEWLQIYEILALKEELEQQQLQSSVEIVDLKSSPSASEQDRDGYYKGKALEWKFIQAQFDVMRDQQQWLVDTYKEPVSEMRMLCLHGEAGAGKSTLAWRVAFEITQNQQRSYLFLRIKDEAKSDIWAPLSKVLVQYKTPVVILVDDVFRRNVAKDEYVLKDPLSYFADSFNVTIIATSRSNEIPHKIELDLPFLQREKVEAPTAQEKERVMCKLNKKDKLSVAQNRRLRNANIWWIMMMELIEGTSLEHHVKDCIQRLRNHHLDKDEVIYRVYEYLCYAGIYQLAIPATLLMEMDERFYQLEEHPLGKDLIVHKNASYTSLHPVFAKYALACYPDKRKKASIFTEIMAAMNESDITHRNFLCSFFYYNVKEELQEVETQAFLQQKAEVKNFLQQKTAEIDAILEQHCTHHELWHYWRGLYNEVEDAEKLSLIEKLMVQKEPEESLDWTAYLKFTNEKNTHVYDVIAQEAVRKHLRDFEKDQNAYLDFLTLITKWGEDKLWAALIEETAQWLTWHKEEENVRVAYIDMVDKYGKRIDCKNAIIDIRRWLQHNRRDVDIRALYIKFVEKHGQEEDDYRNAINDIAVWLETNGKDAHIHALYLGLVEKYGKKEDWEQALKRMVHWFETNEKNPQVLQAYRSLLKRQEYSENIIEEMAQKLKMNDSDIHMLATYLNMVTQWGTATQRRDALDTTMSIWAKHSLTNDLLKVKYAFSKDLLNAFFQLVVRKSHREDFYINLPYLALVNDKGSNLYLRFALNDAIEWLKTDQVDVTVYVACLKMIDNRGNERDWKKAIEETRRWLQAHEDDTAIRAPYLKLVENRGSARDWERAIEETREWLQEDAHKDVKGIHAPYLKLVENRGGKKDWERAIKEIGHWLQEDAHKGVKGIHAPYLKLVENRGSKKDWERAIKEIGHWLQEDAHKDDTEVRAPYLKLVDNRGYEDDWKRAIEETRQWLQEEAHEDDFPKCVSYVKLVENRGSKKDWERAIKEIGCWLRKAEHEDDTEVRAPYLKLVENRGSEDDRRRTIDETMCWFKQQKTKNSFKVYTPYLRLVTMHGDKAQLNTTRHFMEDWLRSHSQTKGIYLIISGYANVLLKLEMYTQAEKEFRRTLDIRRSYVPARIGLAWACYQQGKKKDAYAELKECQRLVELGNEYPREKMLVHMERYVTLEGVQE